MCEFEKDHYEKVTGDARRVVAEFLEQARLRKALQARLQSDTLARSPMRSLGKRCLWQCMRSLGGQVWLWLRSAASI